MKVLNGKLFYEYHELAGSRRTSGVDQIIFDGKGEELHRFPSEKSSGSVELPTGAQYVLRRYWTGSRRPKHTLLQLPGLDEIAHIDSSVSLDDILAMKKVPEGIRSFLISDIF